MLLGVAVASDGFAARGGGRSGGHSGGRSGSAHSSGSHSGHAHRSHGHGRAAVFVGGALFYPWPYSYGFYPLWAYPEPPMPVFYVERFTGVPTPETGDWIYCPARGAWYPEVTECPEGWQRVIPQEQAMPQAPAQ